jgi:hypothetical protein
MNKCSAFAYKETQDITRFENIQACEHCYKVAQAILMHN